MTGKSVGEVKRITSAFTFLRRAGFLTGNIRANASLEPNGCVGDLGAGIASALRCG